MGTNILTEINFRKEVLPIKRNYSKICLQIIMKYHIVSVGIPWYSSQQFLSEMKSILGPTIIFRVNFVIVCSDLHVIFKRWQVVSIRISLSTRIKKKKKKPHSSIRLSKYLTPPWDLLSANSRSTYPEDWPWPITFERAGHCFSMVNLGFVFSLWI